MSASEGDSESSKGEEDMYISESEDVGRIEIVEGPETMKERDDRLNNKVKAKFDSLNKIGKDGRLYCEHIQQDRVVVDVNALLHIFEEGCQHASCSGHSKVKTWKLDVGVLRISWECSNGHCGCWASSKVLCEKNGQDIYTTSLLLAAGVIITGNNIDKLILFSRFLGLNFISRSTFHRLQRNDIIPGITSLWEDMKTEMWKVLSGESIILCGDGRNDSPGHSAKYCVYVLMEQFLELIIDVEVIDKRETGGVSTNMEVFGLKMLLERIVGNLMVSEIVTDASTAVMALVRRMKGMYKEY